MGLNLALLRNCSGLAGFRIGAPVQRSTFSNCLGRKPAPINYIGGIHLETLRAET